MRWIAAIMAVVAITGGLFILFIMFDGSSPVDSPSDDALQGTPGAVKVPAGGTTNTADSGQTRPDPVDTRGISLQNLESLEPSSSSKQQQQIAALTEQVEAQRAAERAEIAKMTSAMTSAERSAAARIAAIEEQVDRERVKSTDLLQDLAQAREQIARSFHDRVISFTRQGAGEEQRVDERIRQAAAPGLDDDTLPMVVRLDVGPALASQFDRTTGRPAIDPQTTHASDGQERAVIVGTGKPPGRDGDVAAPSPPVSAAIAPAKVALPEGVQARVLVEYPHGSEPARRRAVTLSQTLQAQGIDAADPVEVPSVPTSGGVTYFYQMDRASAERVAAVSTASSPIRSRLPANGRLPRPGTIEVAITD